MSGFRTRRKKLKAKWSQDDINRAFKLVEDGTAIREAARLNGIPFSTLQERLKSKNQALPAMGRNPVFTKEQEAEMADQVKFLGNIFYGCTAIQIRKMAYEYAVHNHIKHNFNNTLRMAGKDWLTGFMKRNKLSARKAEGTSLNRAKAFNKHEVSIFFKLLEELMEKYKFLPRNIFNMDETGITSVHYPGKVITEKGQKRVGSITSGERGTTVTAVCAVSATGSYIPPMLIYPRQRHSLALENDGPRGAVYRYSKNGWINEDLFIDWLKHFAAVTKPSETEPILFILDNHSSHISLRAYEFCKESNIVMLSLPPHGSHRIQPLDVSIYGPLKTAYKQECNILMKTELGRKITQNDIASLFRKAYQKIASIPKAEAGFAATGIYPLNPDVFTDEDFLAAEILNSSELMISVEERRNQDNKTPEVQTISLNTEPHMSSSNSPSLLMDQNQIAPETNIVESTQVLLPFIDNATPSTSAATAKDLLPVPKKSTNSKKVQGASRKQHATVLTNTPFKEALIQKEERKLTKEKKKQCGVKMKLETKTRKRPAKPATVRKVKKKLLQDNNKDQNLSDSQIDMADVRDDDDTDVEDLENKCMLCDDYGRNNELWYRCVQCGLWAHAECSGYESPEGYVCDLCR
ncbi:uncharacterized protein LOC123657659 [Melitaea cinxia]|uniref:uncharacterized protein LOC123657659 n=1 Tax=Melitaea cinxia TaxID=113334 RepID=UPI001E273ECB|nr:uncharacterized protein LOC123657659 [Melitaea cinxia]